MERDLEDLTQEERQELYANQQVQDALAGIQGATSETEAAWHAGELARLVSLYGKGMLGNS